MTYVGFFCVAAFLVHSMAAQNFNRPCPQPSIQRSNQLQLQPGQPTNAPCPKNYVRTIVGDGGCPLTISCACPISPNGVAVQSELGIQGEASVSGSLPFLSVVSLDGKLPSNGKATVNYSCGDSNIIITQENNNPCGANAKAPNGLICANLAKTCKF